MFPVAFSRLTELMCWGKLGNRLPECGLHRIETFRIDRVNIAWHTLKLTIPEFARRLQVANPEKEEITDSSYSPAAHSP
jgi:hypothetical protein